MSIRLKHAALASLLLIGVLGAVSTARAQIYGAPGAGGIYGGAGANPYVAMGGGAGVNPYAAGGGGYGSSSGINPYVMYSGGQGQGGIFGSAGGALYGSAQVINAYGNAINAQEQARMSREQVYQMQIDTQRKRFDLAMYIRAHTPTYADEQININKNTLRRVQNNAPPGEITSGKALNVLLDDAGKFRQKIPDAGSLEPEVLRNLNVSSKRGMGIGVLRNDKINWPLALTDILNQDQRSKMALQAKALVNDAAKNKLDANVFRELSNEVSKTREQLLRKVNDMPSDQYMEAKRFLNELDNSLRAVQDGEFRVQSDFDNFIGGKARTMQEVVDYMVANGLRFAPAPQGSEAAYRALYSALVNYDVSLNSQYSSPGEAKE
jgi:hypothetical protein